MQELNQLIAFMNNYLKIDAINDYCPNGLQVEGKNEIRKIVSGVSASLELFQNAKNAEADLIIVHHGIFWNNISPVITSYQKKRVKFLLENDINLAAYHLPLDAAKEIGNNALLAKEIGLVNITEFGFNKGFSLGFSGNLSETVSFDVLVNNLNNLLSSNAFYYNYGKKEINSVGIVSGGASQFISEAMNKNLDVYITGTVDEYVMHMCKENAMNYISLGHYNSEKLGIKALGELVAKKFDIETQFIDVPNEV